MAEKATELKTTTEAKVEELKAAANDAAQATTDKTEEAKKAVAEKAAELKATTEAKVEELKAAASDATQATADKAEEAKRQ